MSPSPIRCRAPWKIHKRSSEPDRWLDEMGIFRKHTARDSSCLFRAVSENIFNTQKYFLQVRLDCVEFMASKRHLFEGSLNCNFENYLKAMSNSSEWGGFIEITAMSHLYRRDFVVFEVNNGPQTKFLNGYGRTIYLFHSPDTNHFDVVYTKEVINTSSFCQSLVYEVLYDGVYQLKDLIYAVDKMLHDKMPTNHIEYFMSENVERRKKQKERAKIFIEATNKENTDRNNNAVALKCKHHTEDLERASLLKESLSIFVFNRSLIQLENVCMNCLNVNSAKDLLDNGITPFPYKVAKALDPDIYRNIEFDVWSEMRRELRYGARYSDGTTLQVGVKCLCRLQPEQSVPYRCHIQEMRPEGGPCLVFIEELGEKLVVNFDQLEPLPIEEVRPWAPPYRFSKANSQFLTLSQMLQQLGNITRKQGLKARNKVKPSDDQKSPEKAQKATSKLNWNHEKMEGHEVLPYGEHSNVDYSAYQHLDFVTYEPMPVEVEAVPPMVDCRPAAGVAPHEMTHSAPNGAPPPENHHNQPPPQQVNNEMGGHGVASPAAVRASTPASSATMTPYTVNPVGYPGGMNPGIAYPGGMMAAGVGGAPYMCGVKSLVWCAGGSPPPPHAPPPPPHGVNPHVFKSVQANGADLPMNDIPTLRYYFNLGVDCMWAAYGPPPPPPPPRHFSPRDLAQDMQQLALQDRGHEQSKHKPPDAKPPLAAKGNGQRPLLGPRFKRGNNQDGNQNQNHNHNKGGHNNNNMGNKGPNNRRNCNNDGRGPTGPMPQQAPPAGPYGDEIPLEPALLPMPYLPYPPPIYPLPYYPVESDPGMMGMMGGMGYVGYEEGVEYAAPLHYYPPPHYPPHPAQPPPHHHEHK